MRCSARSAFSTSKCSMASPSAEAGSGRRRSHRITEAGRSAAVVLPVPAAPRGFGVGLRRAGFRRSASLPHPGVRAGPRSRSPASTRRSAVTSAVHGNLRQHPSSSAAVLASPVAARQPGSAAGGSAAHGAWEGTFRVPGGFAMTAGVVRAMLAGGDFGEEGVGGPDLAGAGVQGLSEVQRLLCLRRASSRRFGSSDNSAARLLRINLHWRRAWFFPSPRGLADTTRSACSARLQNANVGQVAPGFGRPASSPRRVLSSAARR